MGRFRDRRDAVLLHLAATLTDPSYDLTFVLYDNEEVEADKNGLKRLVETRRAIDTIRRVGLDGTALGTVDGFGPAIAVAEGGITTDPGTGAAFVIVDSFEAPTTLWRLPPGAGTAVRWAPVGDEASVALTVERITYPSGDGTEIGLFVLRRPDVTASPDVPMILNGYGGFAISETPRYVGRAVAHLAADPDVARWNGDSLSSGGLAKVYGFTDLDGSQPDAWRYLVEVQDAGRPADTTGYR